MAVGGETVTETANFKSVLSPVITPFNADLTPDPARFVRHCRWLLANDVGLAVFGTNSEANSLSVAERMSLLDALVDAGLPPARMMPGTGCCALTDSVELTAHAVRQGCAGVLMLPPFYYKGVPDEGLYRNFAEVIERVGDRRLRIYLYHIPPVAQVGITLDLIERLLKAYPGTIAGIKDSSGDSLPANTSKPSGWNRRSIASVLLQSSSSPPFGQAARDASPRPGTSIPGPFTDFIGSGATPMPTRSSRP
jgi:4-hydroxy-tetrahydrodipicolinate synthase